jgi:membrane protein DedA with SNARE-associated domain
MLCSCQASLHGMDLLKSHLDFLASHPFGVVFWSSLIEAAGIPFPSRVILILAPAFLATDGDLVRLALVATIGSVLGDHVPYLAGRLAGLRMLGLYCKLTLASERCVEKTLHYFMRFGAAALLLSRFSASVRIFASACAGCGHITYARYLTLDTIGTLVYSSAWVLVGALIGARAVEFFTTDRRRWLFLGFVLLGAGTLIGYRLWRRLRYGDARASHVASTHDGRRDFSRRP